MPTQNMSAFQHSTKRCLRVGAANVGSCCEEHVVMLAALSHCHVPHSHISSPGGTEHDDVLPFGG